MSKARRTRWLALLLMVCALFVLLPTAPASAYEPWVTEDLDVFTSDGITYFDLYDGKSPRPEASVYSTVFLRDALKSKNILMDEARYNSYQMWDAVAASLVSNSDYELEGESDGVGTLAERYAKIFKVNSGDTKDNIVYWDEDEDDYIYNDEDAYDPDRAVTTAALKGNQRGEELQYADDIAEAGEDIVAIIKQTVHYNSGREHLDNSSDSATLNPLDLGIEADGPVFFTVNTVTAEYDGGSQDQGRYQPQGLSWGSVFYDFELAYLNTGAPLNTALNDFDAGGEELYNYMQAGNSVPGVTYNITKGGQKFSVGAANSSDAPYRVSASQSSSVEESISTNRSHTEEYTLGEKFEFTNEWNAGFLGLIGAECSLTLGFESTQMWSDTWERGESHSKSYTTQSSTEVELPPHTQVLLETSQGTTAFTLEYDYPVVITYKVISYAYYFVCMNNDENINNNHGVVLANFGRTDATGDDAFAFGNLENRYNLRYDPLIEHTIGDQLDWESLFDGEYSSEEGTYSYDLEERVQGLINYRPYSVSGGKLSANVDSTNTEVYGFEPLYPLARVRTESAFDYNLSVGDKLYVDNIELIGENDAGVAFYGFNADKGSWSLVNSNGETLPNSNSVAELSTDSNSGWTTLQAKGQGTVYLKYNIERGAYGKMLDNVRTVAIPVNVTFVPFGGKVTATAVGNPVAYLGQPVTLTTWDRLSVTILDENGNLVNTQPLWQADVNQPGISIVNNVLTASQPGSYRIRATYQNKVSDWLTIEVRALANLDSLSVLTVDTISQSGEDMELIALFDPEQYSYDINVINDVKSVSIAALAAAGSVTVNGEDVKKSYDLVVGFNQFTVRVTVGGESNDYIVTIHRSQTNDLPILEISDYAVDYDSASLTLTGAIAINYFIDVLAPEDAALNYDYQVGMLFWDREPEEYTINNSPDKEIISLNPDPEVYRAGSSDNIHVFTFDDIYAKQMKDNIYSVAYVKVGGKYTYSRPLTYSVAAYCKSALAYSRDAKLHAVAVDMLNYGAEAQKVFTYRVNDLANSDLTRDELARGTSAIPTVTKTSTTLKNNVGLAENESVANAAFTAASLVLDSRIAINYFANVTPPTAGSPVAVDAEGPKIWLLQWDSYSATGEYTMETVDPDHKSRMWLDATTNEPNRWKGTLPNVNAKEMRKLFYTRVCVEYEDGSRDYSNILAYSVNDYAFTAKSTPSLVNLINSMMRYGDSAEAYFPR